MFLRWDDPWGGSCNDYDLGLWNGSSFVAVSVNSQTCTQNPLEAFSYTAAASGAYGIVINRFNASGTSHFDLLVLSQQPLQFQVAANSISTPAGSANAGMVAVGAVPWNNPLTLEPFSSQGPMPDGRIKPDLAAPDLVSTLTFGPLGFAGTSAASPHVAGAAAVMRGSNPSLTPAQLKSLFQANAVDLGVGGPDNQFGWGRLDLGVPPGGCPSRPSIALNVQRAGAVFPGIVTPDPTIRLRSIQFGDSSVRPSQPVNGLVDILGLSGLTSSLVALPSRPTSVAFTIRRPAPTAPTTVPMVVTDGCGPWQTLAGAGS